MGQRRGWRIGLGPVFVYEWITSSRRWQGYAARSLFVAVLLAAVFVVWSEQPYSSLYTQRQRLAMLGLQVYQAVIGTQLTLVLLAAPAATAGAICLDRSRGTLAHLFTTDLSNTEIVLGKLASRLLPVLWLVACALPLLALLTLLGGVDPEALFTGFLVTAVTAVLGCTLALTFSLWVGKTHEALLATYAVWALWLLGPYMVPYVSGYVGILLIAPPRDYDPYFLAFAPYWYPGRYALEDYLGFYAVILGISAGLTVLCVWRVRAADGGALFRGTLERGRIGRVRNTWHVQNARIRAWLPGPSLDANPVLWREWHRNRPSKTTVIVFALYFGLSAFFSLLAIFEGTGPGFAPFVNGFQVSIGLLMLSVSAATSLAEERTRGSLDVLMSTPLPTRQIVLGKWLGSFRLTGWLILLPALILAFGPGASNIRHAPVYFTAVVAGYIIAQGAFLTSLGLAVATWTPRLGRAVAITVTVYVTITVGWVFLLLALSNGREFEGFLCASSFFGAGGTTAEATMGGPEHWTGGTILWSLAYLVASAALAVVTLATFNRCLGRVENGLVQDRWNSPLDRRRGAEELGFSPRAEASRT